MQILHLSDPLAALILQKESLWQLLFAHHFEKLPINSLLFSMQKNNTSLSEDVSPRWKQ